MQYTDPKIMPQPRIITDPRKLRPENIPSMNIRNPSPRTTLTPEMKKRIADLLRKQPKRGVPLNPSPIFAPAPPRRIRMPLPTPKFPGVENMPRVIPENPIPNIRRAIPAKPVPYMPTVQNSGQNKFASILQRRLLQTASKF